MAVCGTLLLLVIVVLMVYMCHKKDKQLKGGQLTASASSSQHKAPSEGILFSFILFIFYLWFMLLTVVANCNIAGNDSLKTLSIYVSELMIDYKKSIV